MQEAKTIANQKKNLIQIIKETLIQSPIKIRLLRKEEGNYKYNILFKI
jgi:hypothetical protein